MCVCVCVCVCVTSMHPFAKVTQTKFWWQAPESLLNPAAFPSSWCSLLGLGHDHCPNPPWTCLDGTHTHTHTFEYTHTSMCSNLSNDSLKNNVVIRSFSLAQCRLLLVLIFLTELNDSTCASTHLHQCIYSAKQHISAKPLCVSLFHCGKWNS